MAAHTHALLLTAGLGSRLDPLTRVRAKPAVPVAGDPIARRIVKWLVASGVTNITCNLHHLPHTLTAVLGDGSDIGASIRYSWEQPRVLGSAGGPRQALGIVGAETFFLVNGDTMTDVSLDAISAEHDASGALVTLVLVPNHQPLHYGGVRLGADHAVIGFVRKGPAAAGSFHFIGVQCVSARVFSDLAIGEPASTIGGIYDRLLVENPGQIRGAIVEARFWDVGTVADYRRTSADFNRGADIGARVHRAPSAEVTGSIIWDDVSIGEGARLTDCIVTDGVHVPDGAVHTRAILLRDVNGHLTAVPFPEES